MEDKKSACNILERLGTFYPKPNQNIELEVRFGTFRMHNSKQKFIPGIPEEMFKEIYSAAEQCEDWEKIDDWYEYSNAYYLNDNGKQIRTRMEYPETGEILVHHQMKTVLDHTILQLQNVTLNDVGKHIRLSLSKEIELNKKQVPEFAETDSYRIIQRKSYYLYSGWRYDFSLTWMGRTRAEAEQQQHHRLPTYELEIELMEPCKSYRAYYKTPENILTSLLYKLNDIFQIPPPKTNLWTTKKLIKQRVRKHKNKRRRIQT